MTFPPTTSKNPPAVGFANRDKILEDALINSIYGVDFLDVELRAPSSRLASGGVGAFKPVLGNSTILKAVSPYFSDLLTIHAEEKQPQRCPDRVTDSTETLFDYEDECDSDLEDEPAFDGDEGAPHAASSQPSKYVVPPGAPGASFVSQGDDGISHGWQSVHESASKSTPYSGRRMIYVKDVAASTLEALVLYAYTGKVYFLPPKSSGTAARAGAIAMYTARNTRKRPMCSPKSMYRAACKMHDHGLKSKAREHLLSHLDRENILEELLSPFSSKHPEILEMQFRLLREKFWDGDMATKLDAQIDRIVKGELPHAGQALRLLLREIPPRAKPSSFPSSPASPTDLRIPVACRNATPIVTPVVFPHPTNGPEPLSIRTRPPDMKEEQPCDHTDKLASSNSFSHLVSETPPDYKPTPPVLERNGSPAGLFTPVATPIDATVESHHAWPAGVPLESVPRFNRTTAPSANASYDDETKRPESSQPDSAPTPSRSGLTTPDEKESVGGFVSVGLPSIGKPDAADKARLCVTAFGTSLKTDLTATTESEGVSGYTYGQLFGPPLFGPPLFGPPLFGPPLMGRPAVDTAGDTSRMEKVDPYDSGYAMADTMRSAETQTLRESTGGEEIQSVLTKSQKKKLRMRALHASMLDGQLGSGDVGDAKQFPSKPLSLPRHE